METYRSEKFFHMSQICFCTGFRRPLQGKSMCLQHGNGGDLFNSYRAGIFLCIHFFFLHCRSDSNKMWSRLPRRIDREGRGSSSGGRNDAVNTGKRRHWGNGNLCERDDSRAAAGRGHYIGNKPHPSYTHTMPAMFSE